MITNFNSLIIKNNISFLQFYCSKIAQKNQREFMMWLLKFSFKENSNGSIGIEIKIALIYLTFQK